VQHWVAIAGACLGIIGTVALSFDLLRSKDTEDSGAEFRSLQDQIESDSRELIVRLNTGVSTLAGFLASYLQLLALDEQQKQDPAGSSTASIRGLVLEGFREAQVKLASSADSEHALALVADTRRRIEQRFRDEMARRRRLRRVAIGGVWLVGAGAVAQLVAVLLEP
jgi:hypothetical protein